jgi:dolichol-phosphate mannosyltransferase
MTVAAVTGGTGFVAANLVRRLLADGDEVHVLCRPGSDGWRLAGLDGPLVRHAIDLTDGAALSGLLGRIGPAVVFHLAAHGGHSWQDDPRRIATDSYLGTVNLVLAAEQAGAARIVNAGSSSEYGLKEAPPTEADPLEPNSDYAAAKAAATLFCRQRARRTGMPMPTLRLYSAYGPWENPGRLLPRLATAALAGRLPPLTDPETARDFIYIDDVVEAFLRARDCPLADPGAVYNIGSGQQTTLGQLVELVRRQLGITAAPAWGSMPSRAWDTARWCSDPRKAERELGWVARVPLAEGIARLADWIRSDPALAAIYAAD